MDRVPTSADEIVRATESQTHVDDNITVRVGPIQFLGRSAGKKRLNITTHAINLNDLADQRDAVVRVLDDIDDLRARMAKLGFSSVVIMDGWGVSIDGKKAIKPRNLLAEIQGLIDEFGSYTGPFDGSTEEDE